MMIVNPFISFGALPATPFSRKIIFNTAANATSWVAPATMDDGLTPLVQVLIRGWGAGAAGGNAITSTSLGGGGGSGGFAEGIATINVGATLYVYVGSGGRLGPTTVAANTRPGGGGGGLTGVFNVAPITSSANVPVLMAGAGGGGGGGADANVEDGGGGGGGGGDIAFAGAAAAGGGALGAGPGTTSAGGAGGTGTAAATDGAAGIFQTGGGGGAAHAVPGTGQVQNAGVPGGGSGGQANTTSGGGGGGGAGRYGGGGGEGGQSGEAAGGGGGGSNYVVNLTSSKSFRGSNGATGSQTTVAPANTSEPDYETGKGNGGIGGDLNTSYNGANGNTGLIVIYY